MNRRHFPSLASALLLAVVLGLGGAAAASSGSSNASGQTVLPPLTQGPPPGPLAGPPPAQSGPGGPGRGPQPGLAGTVEALGSGSFTLRAAGTTYTVTVGSDTSYDYAPGVAADFGDLRAGERVAVNGTASGGAVTATAVHIQIWGVRGTVTAVEGGAVTIREASGRTATIQLPASSDASAGQEVEGFGSWNQDTLIASAFRVVPAHLDGVAQAVYGESATIETPGGTTATLAWTSSTSFSSGPGGGGTSSLIIVGAQVHALGRWRGSTFDATAVAVAPAHLDGTVISVSGDSARVKTRSGREVTMDWSGSTSLSFGPASSSSAAEVKAGVHVHADGTWNGATFVARRIGVPPAPPAAPPATAPGS